MITHPLPQHAPQSQAIRRLVLSVLRQHGQLSRRQIARLTGLNGSTLTYVVRDLLDRQILQSMGKAESQNVGPRQTMLQINPGHGIFAGVSLQKKSALVLLTDAADQPLDSFEIPHQHRLDQLPQLLHESIMDRMLANGYDTNQLLGLGVGLPGIVNTQEGILVNSVPFSVQNFPLKQMLQMAFDDLTVIEINHDANFAALAESRWGQTQSHDNFIYILINEAAAGQNTIFRAFGAALFLHGRLYHGTHFAAGELDHNLLPRLESDLDSHAWDNLHKDDAPLTAPLDLLATQLGQSIASITSLLDPGAVIIGCNQIIRNRAFIQRVAERVTKLNLPVPQRHLLVQASDMGQEAITKGAALAATLASDGYTVRQQAEA